MTDRWDKARARAQSITPTKRTYPKPVGEKQNCETPEMMKRAHGYRPGGPTSCFLSRDEVSTCSKCGYHVCSCRPEFMQEESPFKRTPALGHYDSLPSAPRIGCNCRGEDHDVSCYTRPSRMFDRLAGK